MKKWKFFGDVCGELAPWLNSYAEQWFRLTSVSLGFYSFERTSEPVRYAVQFLGAQAPSYVAKYLAFLEENSIRYFRVPINQVSVAWGKIRVRPYAEGMGKLANTFQHLNKEILIVECDAETEPELLTDVRDIAKSYTHQRNAYAQGAVMAIVAVSILLIFACIKGVAVVSSFAVIGLGATALWLVSLVIKKEKYRKYYENESLFREDG